MRRVTWRECLQRVHLLHMQMQMQLVFKERKLTFGSHVLVHVESRSNRTRYNPTVPSLEEGKV